MALPNRPSKPQTRPPQGQTTPRRAVSPPPSSNQQGRRPQPNPQQRRPVNNNPMIRNEKQRESENEKFIDRENKRVVPMGMPPRIPASRKDQRKDQLLFLKIIRLFVFIVIGGLFALGIKNTFFPPQIYTEEEIKSFATEAAGETGFPKQRGAAYAQEFLMYYLDSSQAQDAQAKLAKFYTGTTDSSGVASINRTFESGSLQRPVNMPILFETVTPDKYISVYKYSVLLTDKNGRTTDSSGNFSGRWVSFAVSVYYDETSNKLSIHPDSPTLIPTYEIQQASSLPTEQPLGNGTAVEDTNGVFGAAIRGFLQGYAKSTYDNHKDVDQYVMTNPTPSLISGFGGEVELYQSFENAVKYDVFNGENADEYEVNLIVNWKHVEKETPSESTDDKKDQEAVSTQASVFTSRYVMKMKKDGDKIVVTNFRPHVYFKAEQPTTETATTQ